MTKKKIEIYVYKEIKEVRLAIMVRITICYKEKII